MSNFQLQNRLSQLETNDANLLQRLRIALSVQRRAGWHLVGFTVQNGIVQLTGEVPTFYDRQLIAALVRHVAGVLGIRDNITVGDPSIRRQVTNSEAKFLQGTVKPGITRSSDSFRRPPVHADTVHNTLAGATAGDLYTA